MKIEGSKSLIELARKAPLDSNYSETFRKTATLAVDRAIDVFFKQDREVKEAQGAYDDLTEVQLALKTSVNRTRQDDADNRAKLEETKKTGVPETTVKIAESSEERLKGAFDLTEVTSYATPTHNRLKPTDISGLQGLIKTMNEVLPLYASAAMVPGPLSVSMKTQLQEMFSHQASFRSSSRSRSEHSEPTLLGANHRQSVTNRQVALDQSATSSKTPIDERIIPKLHELRKSFQGLEIAQPTTTNLRARGSVYHHGRVNYTERSGFLWLKKTEKTAEVNSFVDSQWKALGEHTVQPTRLHLFEQNFEAKTPLAKLAQNQPLDTKLADTIRTKGSESLNQAVEIMFNPEREVSQGRAAYDSLTDLATALDILKQRQGDSEKSPLSKLAQAVHELSPLYACVAMVPGDMSATVKSFAKEMAIARSSGSSYSSSLTTEDRYGLFTPRGTRTGQSSSESSSSQSANTHYETNTADERIMTRLHDVRGKLFGLAAEDGKLVVVEN